MNCLHKIKIFEKLLRRLLTVILVGPLWVGVSFAQGDARVGARMDATQIVVGDQARMFIQVQNNESIGTLQWATIPDSFNNLEIVEKGKIDTVKNGDIVTYKQRLLITGFDSGVFKIPAFVFSVLPKSGTPYTIQTDSFGLLVQTVAVDTTKGFKGIKGVVYVKNNWLDYIWYIVAGIAVLVLVVLITIYIVKKRKNRPVPQGPVESLQDYTLRLLAKLDAQQLWQKKQVKEYYVELTDIIRGYIEKRFNVHTMELTTDEILDGVHQHKELLQYYDVLSDILHTADLAKFAKAQPLQQEHVAAMEKAITFVDTSRPVIIIQPPIDKTI
jgi:hypothetical protein